MVQGGSTNPPPLVLLTKGAILELKSEEARVVAGSFFPTASEYVDFFLGLAICVAGSGRMVGVRMIC